jgi:hypothetical protein
VVRRVVVVVGGLAVAAGLTTASTAGGVHTYSTPGTAPLVTGLMDPSVFSGDQQASAFALTRAAGATYVRLQVDWRFVAPVIRPPGFVASDPASPGYSWAGLDAMVGTAESAGLTPILDVVGIPSWAYARRPSKPNGGTPQAKKLGAFATALATRYDGAQELPVHVFQVWNEPNLSLDLSPISAKAYRGMVNAVADAVHAVDPKNLVVAGALEPVGHPKIKKRKWYSVPPLSFMRSLLCLSKGAHPHSTCRSPVRFDVWSHNPYTHGGPFGRAKLPDDIMLGDLPRMRALLRAGVRLHHVVSTRRVAFGATEFGGDPKPPRPNAASLSLAARWTAESLYQMWRSGVSLVTWFLLEDFASPSPFQSGLYFRSPTLGEVRPKPVLTAFRFPFVAYLKGKTVNVWGRDTTSDVQVVTIQRRHGKRGSWQTVASISANRHGIFRASMRLKASKKDWVRATAVGSGTSLPFSLTRPKNPANIGPWGY